jgi:hypothetical protein
LIGEPEPKTTHPLGFADTHHLTGFFRPVRPTIGHATIAQVARCLTHHPLIMSAASRA